MKITNNKNLPKHIYDAVVNDPYDNAGADFSVTQLIDSPRVVAMEKIYADQMEVDISDDISHLIGSAIHKILEENAPSHYNVEQRILIDVDGVKISGGIDNWYLHDTGVIHIEDHKTTSTMAIIISPDGKKDWENQLNMYAELIEEAEKDFVGEVGVWAFLRDWRKAEVERRGDYPDRPYIYIKMKLWDKQERIDYMRTRVALHAATIGISDEASLPPCTNEERWFRPGKFAIYEYTKSGQPRARATRLFDTYEDATFFSQELGRKGKRTKLEHRPGINVRCEDWCRVAKWCSQYKDLKK